MPIRTTLAATAIVVLGGLLAPSCGGEAAGPVRGSIRARPMADGHRVTMRGTHVCAELLRIARRLSRR